jgi:hypothetical protein
VTQDPFVSALYAIAMLGVGALGWGAWRFWRVGNRRKASLMLAVAVILLANILIQTV